MADVQRHPGWLRLRAPRPGVMERMQALTTGLGLHTVCQSARCPNQGECFARGTATFLLLGDTCTRACSFCAVGPGPPSPPDPAEPGRIVEAVRRLGLDYVVLTSVTRDDLPDGGAGHFAAVLRALHDFRPALAVEVLVPDFRGSEEALRTVVSARPAVLGHNLETVLRLYPRVRPGASFSRSLGLLRRAMEADTKRNIGLPDATPNIGEAGPGLFTKSGLMLGLGEERGEVVWAMAQLREAGCHFLTLGQYLRPSPQHHPVVRFVAPEEFEDYRSLGEGMGFRGVASGPLVRSSFHAASLLGAALGEGRVRV